MFALSRDDLEALSAPQPHECISIYTPTVRSGMEQQTNPIRFKNMLQKAEAKLKETGMRKPDIEELLKEARQLQKNTDFWRHTSDGLAVFLSERVSHYFRLPISFDEHVAVGKRFHLKPLMPLMSNDGQFFVLAVSQGANRFLQCTRYGVTERTVPDMPASLGETLAFDVPEKHVGYHAGSRAGRQNSRGKQAQGDAVFHGHGELKEEHLNSIKRYFQDIDRALKPFLNKHDAPMVLAAVQYLQGLYRDISSYQQVLDEGVDGNPDQMDDNELRDRALEIVEPIFKQAQEEAVEKFGDFIGEGQTSRTFDEVVPDALFGRVATLFVDVDAQQYGTIDRETGRVELHDEEQPGDEELVDVAAVETFRQGGKVYALKRDEMPIDAPVAAVLRY